MKMKRAVKAAIAASMAIAVFGVGAVSFAAWQGSAVPSLSVSGTLGDGLDLADQGFDSSAVSNWDSGLESGSGAGFMTGLVPYDQPDNTLPIDGSVQKIATQELPAMTLGSISRSNATIFVQSSDDGLPEGTTRTDGRFFFKLYDTTGETPNAPTCNLDGLEGQGWKEIGFDDSYLSLASIGTFADGVLSDVGIAVIYYSEDLAQAGNGFAFTISLFDPTAAD